MVMLLLSTIETVWFRMNLPPNGCLKPYVHLRSTLMIQDVDLKQTDWFFEWDMHKIDTGFIPCE